jgi:ATP-dependent DNA helicase DinG
MGKLWQKVQVPPVCPAKACPAYDDCYYYKARRRLEKGKVVITNHSVVITDAQSADPELDKEGILGKYDFLILDEAHDFPSAAINGLEFEITGPKLSSLQGIATRLEQHVAPVSHAYQDDDDWAKKSDEFREQITQAQKDLMAMGMVLTDGGIVAVSPAEIDEHPAVQKANAKQYLAQVEAIAERVRLACDKHAMYALLAMERYRQEARVPEAKQLPESTRNYISFIRDFAVGAHSLSRPEGASVSYVGSSRSEAILRHDVIDLQEPLRKLIWDRTPYACLSATMQIDNEFEHFERATGAKATFNEVLPSPFDFSTQSALYLPPQGRIPDPTQSRGGEMEQIYYRALAAELSHMIEICDGRTLALFHSRKEMEGVYAHMRVSSDLPILIQSKTGVAMVGEQFKKNIYASLFALRSFWTGFDAPGETCSCVAVVRIPFEVPNDPQVVARMAYLHQQGLDPFMAHTLPNAKMMMRQGAGRLIRSVKDKGIIALLDPRLRTKRYGEQILANFPDGMRTFDDFADAAGWIGIGGSG